MAETKKLIIPAKSFQKDIKPGPGVQMRTVHRKSFSITDKGRPGRGPDRFELEEGTLRKHGYSLKDGDSSRQAALRRAIAAPGNDALEVFRKVNALSVLFKQTSGNKKNVAEFKRRAEADKAWILRNYSRKEEPKLKGAKTPRSSK